MANNRNQVNLNQSSQQQSGGTMSQEDLNAQAADRTATNNGGQSVQTQGAQQNNAQQTAQPAYDGAPDNQQGAQIPEGQPQGANMSAQQQAERNMVSDQQLNNQENIQGQPANQQTPGAQQTAQQGSQPTTQQMAGQGQPQQQDGSTGDQLTQVNNGANNLVNNQANNSINTNANTPTENSEPAARNAAENPENSPATGLNYIGGGWYELPDGTKIQGEDQAKKALEEYNNEMQLSQQKAAEKNMTSQRQQAKTQDEPERRIYSTAEGDTIQAIGPKEEKSGAEILRYRRKDGRRGHIDIRAGQVLYVGEDITTEEAEELINSQIWKFERVTI